MQLAHNKTYNKTCVTFKDSDQPVHLLSMARVLVYPSLDSLEAVEGTLQPLYNTVRYNMVLDITRFKDGSQKCIDYIEK